MNCTFAHPGTYGHECGAPASKVAVKPLRLNDNLRGLGVTGTESGMFYAPRCEACASIVSGENAGATIEALDTERHVNVWIRGRK